jgi:molybdopterin/thiamine biosynthesis adenylyltransferase
LPLTIDLLTFFPQLANGINTEIGDVDVISGGAITHAFLYCLLRAPDLNANLRVVEEQCAELSNVNRYALLRASDEGRPKAAQLEASSTRGIIVSGVRCLFTKETRERLLPLADRVLVGVDDVEARWWIQDENPSWLCIGATGNHLAQLTTHVPAGPCAGCAHSVPLPPQTIPTISFVSFWAGLLQACALLCPTPPVSRNIVVYPFALGGPTAVRSNQLVSQPGCPVGCAASRVARDSSVWTGS